MDFINTLTPKLLSPDQGETTNALGAQMTFKITGEYSDDHWLVPEYTAPFNFADAPSHWHKITTEIFFVWEGELTLNEGKNTLQADPSRMAFVPPGSVHSYCFARQVLAGGFPRRIGKRFRRASKIHQG